MAMLGKLMKIINADSNQSASSASEFVNLNHSPDASFQAAAAARQSQSHAMHAYEHHDHVNAYEFKMQPSDRGCDYMAIDGYMQSQERLFAHSSLNAESYHDCDMHEEIYTDHAQGSKGYTHAANFSPYTRDQQELHAWPCANANSHPDAQAHSTAHEEFHARDRSRPFVEAPRTRPIQPSSTLFPRAPVFQRSPVTAAPSRTLGRLDIMFERTQQQAQYQQLQSLARQRDAAAKTKATTKATKKASPATVAGNALLNANGPATVDALGTSTATCQAASMVAAENTERELDAVSDIETEECMRPEADSATAAAEKMEAPVETVDLHTVQPDSVQALSACSESANSKGLLEPAPTTKLNSMSDATIAAPIAPNTAIPQAPKLKRKRPSKAASAATIANALPAPQVANAALPVTTSTACQTDPCAAILAPAAAQVDASERITRPVSCLSVEQLSCGAVEWAAALLMSADSDGIVQRFGQLESELPPPAESGSVASSECSMLMAMASFAVLDENQQREFLRIATTRCGEKSDR
jgi:hypothetical protein